MTYKTFDEMTKNLTEQEVLKIVNAHLAHKEQQRAYHQSYNARRNEMVKAYKEVQIANGKGITAMSY